jgi:hypothetical protein
MDMNINEQAHDRSRSSTMMIDLLVVSNIFLKIKNKILILIFFQKKNKSNFFVKFLNFQFFFLNFKMTHGKGIIGIFHPNGFFSKVLIV